jgi:glycosyltransferase involved in cell wall biosynthesis
MKFSVIICTYRRAAELVRLLQCLAEQTHRDFEVLVVDGSGEDRTVRDAMQRFTMSKPEIKMIESPKGLTRQRNVGLRNADGEIVVFFDDDVAIKSDFLARVADIFAKPDHDDVGGLTAYDVQNYPSTLNLRWRLRRLIGVIPTLEPGFADRLGRNVPLSFFKPFHGCRTVSWLPGFCMIYRQRAIDGLAFDEVLPTYGGEDRDFSMRVGEHWKLILCGDLPIQHLCSSSNRVSGTNQLSQTAFGIGRSFRKRAHSYRDTVTVITYAVREFFVESIAGFAHPNWSSVQSPFVRIRGLWAGWRSLRLSPATEGIRIGRSRLGESPTSTQVIQTH